MADTDKSVIERVAEMGRDVAVCGREIGELKKKLDDQAAILAQMRDMNGNIMVLAEQVKHLATSTSKLDERLAAVESRPAKRWDTIAAAGLSGVVAFLIGFLTK